jgi:uncharacterized protein YabN with tetrapyrrole methylase and pyrophosphatase domain
VDLSKVNLDRMERMELVELVDLELVFVRLHQHLVALVVVVSSVAVAVALVLLEQLDANSMIQALVVAVLVAIAI